jgi:DNA processing protein
MTEADTELNAKRALMVLNALPNIGPITHRRLLEAFDGDPVRALTAPPGELKRIKGVGDTIAGTVAEWPKHFNWQREEAQMGLRGVKFVTAGDAGYPPLLRDIHDPPIGLYAQGDYTGLDRAVAIIGSRRSTLYGIGVARKLAGDLAKLGLWVVSGGARGIDAAAHEGALAAGGKTAVVLGNGVDIVYPPEHQDLFKRIAKTGVVLSEFPLGRKANAQTFPMRNRLIAGMCRAVVVVESDVNGGSMITAGQAVEQGREVFAVPGRIDQPASRGCHKLIRSCEAKLLTGIEDILEEWRMTGQLDIKMDVPTPADAPAVAPEVLAALGEDAKRIYELLKGANPTHPDEMVAETDLPSARVAASLLLLELKRLVVKRVDGKFEAR